MRTYLLIGILFLTSLSFAQNGFSFASQSYENQFITADSVSLEETDLPEEQDEQLSALEVMILKEIGKAMSFEERKSTIFGLIEEAKTYIGTPYVYGGTTRKGIDCSAFMQSVYSSNAITLPRVSRNQALMGEEISYQDIEMGDMIFFSNSPASRISHVGMVVEVTSEDIYFIHAGSSTGVTISPLSMNYWNKRFRFAKRVFGDSTEDLAVGL